VKNEASSSFLPLFSHCFLFPSTFGSVFIVFALIYIPVNPKNIDIMATGYHPERSQVKDGTMADWLIAPVTGSLLEVPGIGPATVKVLQENGVTTTYQLFGKFLSFKDEGSWYLWILLFSLTISDYEFARLSYICFDRHIVSLSIV